LLVVDDDALLRRALADGLASGALEVLQAGSGAEALALCRTRPVHVVALDQRLPDVEGHLLCAPLLEAAGPETKLLFITAHPSFENALQAIRAGAFDYLSKPFELEQLRLAVERALRTLRLEGAERRRHTLRRREASELAVVGLSSGLVAVGGLLDVAAGTDVPVLITGETGTGKGLLARAIHHRGSRTGELVTVNCAALPESLFEAELFGHERGSFTGATTEREGLVEAAEGGTLFLDEIGEMPLALQAKLLQVVEERAVRRLGARRPRSVDFRLVAASNRDLAAAVAAGSFRADLLYRLDVLRIALPPLRERPSDLPELCAHLLARGRRPGAVLTLDSGEMERLRGYSWPGNVRELANVLERAALLQPPPLRPSALLPAHSAPPSAAAPDAGGTLQEMERRQVTRSLQAHGGNLARTARALDISVSTLKRKLRAWGARSTDLTSKEA
jgi:DNA-binding NtrC family response regulator